MHSGHLVETTVGERLAELRRRASKRAGRRITQADLALHIGVARQTVVYWENGSQIPSGENLVALADSLGTTPEYILTGEGSADTRSRYFERAEDSDAEAGEDSDTAWLNLPDISFLHPRAQAFFNEAILEYIRRKWTPETIESAAALLLGYFTRASTLQSSGVSQPELSEEMQMIVLQKSKEEIDYAFKGRGPGSKR